MLSRLDGLGMVFDVEWLEMDFDVASMESCDP
jgi:hypothetical protein